MCNSSFDRSCQRRFNTQDYRIQNTILRSITNSNISCILEPDKYKSFSMHSYLSGIFQQSVFGSAKRLSVARLQYASKSG